MKFLLKRIIYFKIVIGALFLCSTQIIHGQGYRHKESEYDLSVKVDKVLSRMSTREKFAQLFIVAFNDDLTDKSTIEAMELVVKEKIGGLIIMNSSLLPGAEMINRLQSMSEIPLLVTLDGEWGAAMRFDTLIAFPRQMQMAAMRSDSLVFLAGAAIGNQTKRLGMDVNYAPTIDINNNPSNPVINIRAFGENKDVVAKYGTAYINGMQSVGVSGSAKHFPGHGDTDIDSHHALPVLPFSRARLDSLELYPFRRIIESGTDMIMIGHLEIPSLDSTGRPSSISAKVVTELLREELGYNGIIITDALNMKGVSEYMAPEKLPLEAFKAGSDLILMPENVFKALDLMERAVIRGDISEQTLNFKVKKMLMLKAKKGILEFKEPIDTANLEKDLNSQYNKSLIADISEQSITIIKNDNDILPLRNLAKQKLALLSLGGDKFGEEFATLVNSYKKSDTVVLRGDYKTDSLSGILKSFENHDHVIIAMHNTDARPQKGFGIDTLVLETITEFAKEKPVTFVYFGNPLALSFLNGHENFKSVVLAYQNTLFNNIAAVHKIFGATDANGRLPVTTKGYSFDHSITTVGGIRLANRVPTYLSVNYDNFSDKIEGRIALDLENGIYNGAHLILLDGSNIVYNKRFGSFDTTASYGIGNISNMLTLLPATIMLENEGRLSLEEFHGNDLISDLLMHRDLVGNSQDGEVYHDLESIEKLKGIIQKKLGGELNGYLMDKMVSPLEIGSFDFTDGIVNTNADEIAKFVYMLFFQGEYAGEKILDQQVTSDILLFLHYHSTDKNGSIVWTDNDHKRAVIFINDGTEKSTAGDVIRSAYMEFLSGEN
ncbi:MAG: glycoside hydrolase family 3 protein [Bacteroidia bacterium]|nr:glycoside hydrolase family 3 protein [Bacteroidia bacterium]